jgi:excisionase family DNA binding protein
MTDIPQLLTLAEVSEKLRVSSHTVRSWVRSGKLKPVRICRRLLFSPDELVRFLNQATKEVPHADSAHEVRNVVGVVTFS